MSRQFIKLHVDLLDNPDYRAFFVTPANLVYMAILEEVFRADLRHPERFKQHELYGFWKEGWLCTRISSRQIHRRIPERSQASIQRDIKTLEEMGLLDTYPWPAAGAPLIQIGFWQWATSPSGRKLYNEVWYVDRVFSDEYYPRFDEQGELP
jgi:hypothetical protein